ncbi:hypothetical protein O9993_17170 [Vibrio lentus]|nr:hypothetical protein [Vibrio lentus]
MSMQTSKRGKECIDKSVYLCCLELGKATLLMPLLSLLRTRFCRRSAE